ncbi:MAG TPA: helix-turn-helix transcriptional regulator [Actinokineospora sp.]|nr:helix-turn-helix transcriptional regulator [Actinokineospora sp.]
MRIEEAQIGRRVREVRLWRGKSLTALAGLAGMSPAYLSMIERGLRPVTKRATLESLARALQVAPTELTGRPYSPTDAESNTAHAGMPGVIDALTSWSIGEAPDHSSRTWDELRAESEWLTLTLRPNADYANQATMLPALIRDLLATAVAGAHRTEALVCLLSAYTAAACLARDLGVAGLATLAAERVRRVAEELDDPGWLAYAAYRRAHLLTGVNRVRQYELAAAAAELPGARVEVAGMSHLTAAFAAATQGDGATALDHLAAAERLAERIEPDVSPWMQTNFGRTNVGIWRVGIGVELGEGAKIAEVAAKVRPEAVSRRRQADFWIDYGRGLLTERKHQDRGVAALLTAEKLAPQRVRNDVFVREAVSALLVNARRDAGGRELRGLAWRTGIAPTG